ncbi:unnamed protein product, partial [Amoebophrya sp. A25]|eukprot:GSA25T00011367001.1
MGVVTNNKQTIGMCAVCRDYPVEDDCIDQSDRFCFSSTDYEEDASDGRPVYLTQGSTPATQEYDPDGPVLYPVAAGREEENRKQAAIIDAQKAAAAQAGQNSAGTASSKDLTKQLQSGSTSQSSATAVHNQVKNQQGSTALLQTSARAGAALVVSFRSRGGKAEEKALKRAKNRISDGAKVGALMSAQHQRSGDVIDPRTGKRVDGDLPPEKEI